MSEIDTLKLTPAQLMGQIRKEFPRQTPEEYLVYSDREQEATLEAVRSDWKLLGEIVSENWTLKSFNIRGAIYLEALDWQGKMIGLTHLYDLPSVDER